MKTKNSIRNTIIAFSTNIIVIVVGVIAQAIFIKVLGSEFLGINSLFNNIVSLLGIVELGLGSAIIYSLYKVLNENNIEQIKSLMKFYKNSYQIISLIILILGIFIMPLLNFFITDITVNINIHTVFLLFLFEVYISYQFSYKRSLIYADQKNYVVNMIHISYLVIMNVAQLIILFITKNFYIYLIIKIIMRFVENICITLYANKKYPYLLDKNIEDLDINTKKDIFSKIKALFFHKIGGFMVLGTDNILISKFFGVITVGLYSNYYLIINAINKLFGTIVGNTSASVGHMLVTESKERAFSIFKRIRFLNFWIATFTAISLMCIIEPFIVIWLGEKFVLSFPVLLILVINYYQNSMRTTYISFKEAAGIFVEDKYIPLIEAFINLFFSLIMLKYFGLAGVFIGTFISSLLLWLYSFPKFVYKKLFGRSYSDYAKETIGYNFLFITILMIGYILSIIFISDNIFITIGLRIIISIIVPNIVLLLVFFKSDNFKYYLGLLKNIILGKE